MDARNTTESVKYQSNAYSEASPQDFANLESPEQLQALIDHINALQVKEKEYQDEIAQLEKEIASTEQNNEVAKMELLNVIKANREEDKAIADLESQIATITTDETIALRETSCLKKLCARKHRQIELLRHRIMYSLQDDLQQTIELDEAMKSEIPNCQGCLPDGLSLQDIALSDEQRKAKDRIDALCPPAIRQKTKAEMFRELSEISKTFAADIAHNTPEGDIMGPIEGEWTHPVCPRLTWRRLLEENDMHGIVERLLEEDMGDY